MPERIHGLITCCNYCWKAKLQIVTGRRRLRFHQPPAPEKWVTMEGNLEKGMSQTITLSTILCDGCFRAGIDKLCLGDQIRPTACFCKTCKLRMDIGCRLLVPSLNQVPRAKRGASYQQPPCCCLWPADLSDTEVSSLAFYRNETATTDHN